ncbi:MAG: sulfatase [Verrucomicrobiales bacterium VVV1]|nr:MAG: sulfatase [Verrucomicrobiales bacterium VVV1]
MNHPSITAFERFQQDVSRRTFLQRSFAGIGGMALSELLGAPASPLLPGQGGLHFPAKAKRIIHLCMAGGPSHLESFDPKPKLDELNGKPFPASFTAGQQLAQLQGRELIARGSFTKFRKWGKSGTEISELFPHIGGIADEICVIRSMVTEQINHDPAHAFMNTGSILKGRPSMGSWLLYGLGSETQDLPGYVVMVSRGKEPDQPISARQWSAGFLPSKFQGVQFQSKGSAVHYVGNPDGVCQSTQRQVIEEVQRLNGMLREEKTDPEIETRISQYEMAFRMQTSVPELTDMRGEPQHVLDLYGVKQPGDGSFASNCLLARRMLERGVRFVQLYHRGWDQHADIEKKMPASAQLTDQATAALVMDLKQRGLLDDTLIIWGGEFGRTPMGQGTGRDHHIKGFSLWMAGAGIKPGMVHGATDELGYASVQDIVHVRDLHATLLHQFGIDHNRLTRKFQGLDYKLTGVEPAKPVKAIMM